MNIKKCYTCKKTIKGRFVVFKDRYYCASCGVTCASCGKKVTQLYEHKADKSVVLCKSCYINKYAEKCSCCNRAALTYYKVKNRVYCEYCIKTSQCVSCTYPVGKSGVKIDKGLYSCVACYKKALLSPGDLVKYYKKVRKFLKKEFSMVLPEIHYLYLAKLHQMKHRRNKYLKHTRGYYKNENGEISIYILRGLSISSAIGVLAHEMTHIWQVANNISHANTFIYEGFAEWVSYKTLCAFKYTHEAELKIRNLFPQYSRGLQICMDLEKKKGVGAVFNYIRNN